VLFPRYFGSYEVHSARFGSFCKGQLANWTFNGLTCNTFLPFVFTRLTKSETLKTMAKEEFAPHELYYFTPQRRDLYFKIIDEIQLAEWICPRLYFLEEHFPPNLLNLALKWLVNNQIVGNAFLQWFGDVAHGSNLQMHAELLKVATNQGVERVLAGKNFKT
jgi:hypothetical protein